MASDQPMLLRCRRGGLCRSSDAPGLVADGLVGPAAAAAGPAPILGESPEFTLGSGCCSDQLLPSTTAAALLAAILSWAAPVLHGCSVAASAAVASTIEATARFMGLAAGDTGRLKGLPGALEELFEEEALLSGAALEAAKGLTKEACGELAVAVAGPWAEAVAGLAAGVEVTVGEATGSRSNRLWALGLLMESCCG